MEEYNTVLCLKAKTSESMMRSTCSKLENIYKHTMYRSTCSKGANSRASSVAASVIFSFACSFNFVQQKQKRNICNSERVKNRKRDKNTNHEGLTGIPSINRTRNRITEQECPQYPIVGRSDIPTQCTNISTYMIILPHLFMTPQKGRRERE
jgi:hypothetical protein